MPSEAETAQKPDDLATSRSMTDSVCILVENNLIKKFGANGKPLKSQINKDYKVSLLSRQ